MEDSKILLKIIGLTNSTIQPTSWAVILSEADGPYKIPIVIASLEAQAISVAINGYTTPRPLTQDLLTSISHAFGLRLTEVFIYRFEDGVFYSQLTFTDGERTVELDSRTSDAIALALRFRAPIYTTREVINETGMIIDLQPAEEGEEDAQITQQSSSLNTEAIKEPSIEKYSVEELEKLMEKLIAAENYEEAAKVSAILNRKRNKE